MLKTPLAQDQKELSFLATLYYLFAGLFSVMLIPSFYVFVTYLMGLMSDQQTVPRELIAGVLLADVVIIIVICVFIWFLVKTANSLKKQVNWKYCMTVSLIICLAFTLGTLLGIMTTIILRKPNIRESFTPQKSEPKTAS